MKGFFQPYCGGYDGKGQFFIKSAKQITQAWASMSGVESVLESFVNFKRELSLIAVRGIGGEHKYYPLVENLHRQGILRLTTAPAKNIKPEI
ncbi:MAG: ATP-grasp domain-containing protein, partial [Candidatus Thioglobus sp.]|nr:ATP-grasp domain-containing protein [Candidatus Thioglobus sp.]